MEDPKYLCFNGAKNFHKVTSLGELDATEIQQNIIEMFFVRVYFSLFCDQLFLAHKAVFKSLIFFLRQSLVLITQETSWYLAVSQAVITSKYQSTITLSACDF